MKEVLFERVLAFARKCPEDIFEDAKKNMTSDQRDRLETAIGTGVDLENVVCSYVDCRDAVIDDNDVSEIDLVTNLGNRLGCFLDSKSCFCVREVQRELMNVRNKIVSGNSLKSYLETIKAQL